MNPIRVKLPGVKGSGSRKGWNKLIVGTKGSDEFQGEFLDGDSAEMLPGDLLLSVKPIGMASSNSMGAVLYRADPLAENNLRTLVVRTDWPHCKEFLVGKCDGLLAQRPTPGMEPALVATDPQVIADFRAAAVAALQAGFNMADLLAQVQLAQRSCGW
jgi:hypothetical protein